MHNNIKKISINKYTHPTHTLIFRNCRTVPIPIPKN